MLHNSLLLCVLISICYASVAVHLMTPSSFAHQYMQKHPCCVLRTHIGVRAPTWGYNNCRLISSNQPKLTVTGSITLYNAYQSSDYDKKSHPANAAIDGDLSTSSQTAVDTKSCWKLNQEGLYGSCGMIGECMSSPYYTGAYASTPDYPYWTAGFSSDISVSS